MLSGLNPKYQSASAFPAKLRFRDLLSSSENEAWPACTWRDSRSGVSHPDPLTFGLFAAPAGHKRSPEPGTALGGREVPAAAAGEGIHEAAEGKECFSTPAGARKEAGNLPALLELHLHLPEAWRGQERGPRAPHPDLQEKEGNGLFFFFGSTGHKAIAPAAEDTPPPSKPQFHL